MKLKGLFIGLTTVDIQYFVDQYPVANSKTKAEKPLLSAGGPAANAAIAYAYLGGDVDFLSCVGRNFFTQIIQNDFSAHGVHLIDYMDNKAFHPIVATVITSANADRTIITHHPDRLEIEKAEDLIDVSNYHFVFVDGFYPDLAIPLCKKAKQLGLPVIFDGGSWKPHLPELLPWVDVAICSDDFFPPDCKNTIEVMNYLREKGIKEMAISKGEKHIETPQVVVPVDAVQAVDSLGAGDVLHGAFCWYFIEKKKVFSEALRLAAKVASQSVKYKGTRSWMVK